jgi:endonuclease-3 related protein
LLVRLGGLPFDPLKADYQVLRAWFMDGLAARPAMSAARPELMYNEYHALIVQHAKRHCRAKALCVGCPFSREP